MKKIQDVWFWISLKFNSLPGPVKAIFWTLVAAQLVVLNIQLGGLKTGNMNIDAVFPAAIAFISYLIAHISSLKAEAEQSKKIIEDVAPKFVTTTTPTDTTVSITGTEGNARTVSYIKLKKKHGKK